MKINGLKKLTTDVLIIGGGTAGCYAALTTWTEQSGYSRYHYRGESQY